MISLLEERLEQSRRDDLMIRRARKAYWESADIQAAYPTLVAWMRCLRAAMAGTIPAGKFTQRFIQ